MSILSKASFVQIPSGYGEDVLYSEVPNTTNGDFQFTRASTGTRVNSDGYIEEVPWNLASYSEDYSSGGWVATRLSVTTNDTTSPRGDTTADKIITTTSGSENRIRNSSFYQAPNTEHTFSAYAKKGNVNWFLLRNIAYGNLQEGRVWFDLDNGVVGTINTGFTASIEDVGDGWFRCSMTCTTTSNPLQIVDFSPATNDNDFQSDSVGEFCYVWGVQLVKGTSVKPYIKTTDRLDIPRLDYSGGASCPTLLLEPQRTNDINYSEDFSQWGNGNIINTDQAISPSGLVDADEMQETLTYNYQYSFKFISGLTTSTDYVLSTFVKDIDQQYFQMSVYNGGIYVSANFDLTNETITTATAGSNYTYIDSSIQDFGDGWYKVILIFQTAINNPIVAFSNNNSSTAAYIPRYTGTGKKVLVWGAMLEQGSYPTSYIPTSGTSVTRVAEVCSLTNASDLIGQTEGVVFIDFELETTLEPFALMNIYNTLTPINGINFFFNTSGVLNAICFNSGYQAIIASGVLSEGRFKAAFAYKENDFAFYLNGSLIGVDTLGSVPNCDALRLENYQNSPSFQEKTKVYQAQIYKTRLTNSELETLTTPIAATFEALAEYYGYELL